MRSLLLLALAAVLLLPGCRFYDHPMTEPSRSINTWMTGVWEYPQANGELLQAVVMPKDNNHYAIAFREFGKNKKLKTLQEYDAWISRVGLVSFLTVNVDGRYLPVHFQLLSPIEVRLRLPDLDAGSESLMPRELRKQVRDKFKAGTLLANDGQTWQKVSEIYWPLNGTPSEQPMNQPLRYAPLKERPVSTAPATPKIGL